MSKVEFITREVAPIFVIQVHVYNRLYSEIIANSFESACNYIARALQFDLCREFSADVIERIVSLTQEKNESIRLSVKRLQDILDSINTDALSYYVHVRRVEEVKKT